MTDTAKLIFGKNKGWVSRLILFVTRSHWSHVAYIDEETGNIIEAAGGRGVVVTTYEQFCQRYTTQLIAEIPVYDKKYVRDQMIQHIGKEYDLYAIFGILFRLDWDNSDRWTCSELIAHCSQLFRANKLFRVTPEQLYVLSKDSDFDFSKFTTR